jgi:prolyl oligopeptidase
MRAIHDHSQTLAEHDAARANGVTELLHGVEIYDPYRWLEDETDLAVQRWTEAQDARARSYLRAIPGRAQLRRRVGQLLNVGSVGCPVQCKARLFYTRQAPGQNQPTIRMRVRSRERLVLDPNRLSADGTVALDWWYPSPDGRLIAYGLSVAGDEQSTLYVRHVSSGKDLADRLVRTRAASVAWTRDGSGFYYTRYPEPGSVPAGEEHYHRRVVLHRLGDDQALDSEVFAPAHPEAWPNVSVSAEGRYLLIVVSHGWSRSDVFFMDLLATQPSVQPIVEGDDALYDGEIFGDTLYLHTNAGAPKYRILAVDLTDPRREAWREIVPESDAVLDAFGVAAGHLVLHELIDATSRLSLRQLDGTSVGPIPLPGMGSVTGIGGEPHGDSVYYGFTSFAVPTAAYAFRPAQPAPELVASPRVPSWLASLDAVVEQVWYTSRDGTRISMFLMHRSDVLPDGQRPTLLTGYGGFNVSRTPGYAPTALTWVERGGVWALPNLRGGGEYGEDWHRAGMLERKQNVFDDFIAAAQWLVEQRYTRPERLAISGGSNGGLLVGAVLTQCPELFRAVVCAVPLLDMLRYHLFRIARLWVPEYGSAEDAEQFRWLLAYSPYHRVRDGVAYPAVLLTTGEQDSRVDPLHARKMAARLQAASTSERPILLRVESRAGHGAGKPLALLAEEQADVLAFLSEQLSRDVN